MSLYQRRDLSMARLLVATSASEYESLRIFGLRQPIAIIPNGVDFRIRETTRIVIKSEKDRCEKSCFWVEFTQLKVC